MTILKTQSGLLLYSPVALNAEHVASIRALGKVTDIVAPNLFHHMYLRPCVAAFPDANCWVPEGLLEKIGPVDGAQIITPDIIFGNDDNIKKFTLTGHRIQETMIFHEPAISCRKIILLDDWKLWSAKCCFLSQILGY